jgi:hypothetical protein
MLRERYVSAETDFFFMRLDRLAQVLRWGRSVAAQKAPPQYFMKRGFRVLRLLWGKCALGALSIYITFG